MAQPLDFTDVLAALERASAFELYRLQHAIDLALEDLARVTPVMAALRPGLTTRYFDAASNAEKSCTVVRVRRKTITVRQHEDGQLYSVAYYMLNLEGVETGIRERSSKGLSRQTLSVDMAVGFVDSRRGRQITGTVERLNPKTVTIRTEEGRWRVPYSLLFPVIEGQVVSQQGDSSVIELLPEDVGNT